MNPVLVRLDARLIEVLRRRLPIELIYRFGSTAKVDGLRPDADIDLAVQAAERLDPVECFDLANELAADLGIEVDLIDLATASTVMRKEIVAHGHCLFALSPRIRDEFQMYALSDYARLNEERRPVLEKSSS